MLETPRLVWERRTEPRKVLKYMSWYTLAAYIFFISIGVYSTWNTGTQFSVSAIAASSKLMTLYFTAVVYAHSYVIQSYLVIIAEYLGGRSLDFKVVAFVCIAYNISLLVLTYLPITDYRESHNIFAILSLFFASGSVFTHRQTVWSDSAGKYLIVAEFAFLTVIIVSAVLFWFKDYAIGEYILIGMILIDKELKIRFMEHVGVITTENSHLVMSYYSPRNPGEILRPPEPGAGP